MKLEYYHIFIETLASVHVIFVSTKNTI